MKGFSRLTFVGQIRKEPTYRVLTNGTDVVNFEVAYCEKKGEEWIWTNMRVTMFGKIVETLKKYYKEKMWVEVTGKLEQESWEKDGERKTGYRLNASFFTLLGDGDGGGIDFASRSESKKSTQQEPTASKSQTKMEASDFPDDDEIPF